MMLTQREQTVLDLVCDGHCVTEAAFALGISFETVRNHLTHVYRKLIDAGAIDGTKTHRKVIACVWLVRTRGY